MKSYKAGHRSVAPPLIILISVLWKRREINNLMSHFLFQFNCIIVDNDDDNNNTIKTKIGSNTVI